MARHDQKTPDLKWVCDECRVEACLFCIDTHRLKYTDTILCRCELELHTAKIRETLNASN